MLQDNGGDNLSVSANGTFTFAAPVVNSAAYDVTVQTNPLRAVLHRVQRLGHRGLRQHHQRRGLLHGFGDVGF